MYKENCSFYPVGKERNSDQSPLGKYTCVGPENV
jgi:hypothetical protein